MTRARCWNLRMNLDVFNAAFAALDDDTERSKFLVGLSRGMNGGPNKAPTGPLSLGFKIGHEMRQEAEDFRSKKTVDGLKGGRPKVNQDGNHVVNQDGNQSGTQSSIPNPTTMEPQTKPLPGNETLSREEVEASPFGRD